MFSNNNMKKILLVFLFCFATSNAQVNYAEIGEQFNRQMQDLVKQREQMKKYYENLYFEAKDKINSRTKTTGDYKIDKLIFKLKTDADKLLSSEYRMLTSGITKPNNFQFRVRKIQDNFINYNMILSSLLNFKKQLEYEQIKTETFYQLFNHISKISIQNGSFTIDGIMYRGSKSLNNIESFFNYYSDNKKLYQTDVNEYNERQAKLIAEKKRIEAARLEEKRRKALQLEQENIRTSNSILHLLERRKEKLSNLNLNDKNKYLKKEFKYVKKIIKHRRNSKWLIDSKVISDYKIENVARNIRDNINRYDRETYLLFIESLKDYCDCD